MAGFVYYIFKFTPPLLDEALKNRLRTLSEESLRDELRRECKKEWAHARAEARPFVIFGLIALLLCLLGVAVKVKGTWETVVIGAMVGICLAMLSGVISAAALWEHQIKRRRWFTKAKVRAEREAVTIR